MKIPRQPGLLYAGTDTQVWVSFDDGDHWQSLRHNMPAISVRDLQIKDDAKCRCADLIAGTHGRGFWILDDVTPLRQAAAVKAALAKNEPYLFKPGTGGARALRRQRTDAVAAGASGRRKRAARRADRLLPARRMPAGR